ncbi:hypothetical protein TRFO_01642 [Tritrichomonas foetus]|uniref:CBM20 domain-containing protein n=1 Tax=Tritrichomonas foetus TaxID=1144522 RepID=A0A1J4JU82_9EUKA|nr:hypothetical protein TRFO_01642 [Tritrichomonas foetus]|eukprot:OHT01076.1 hypothetical protein TRFO_01642 [Tritrichomonas foetus]
MKNHCINFFSSLSFLENKMSLTLNFHLKSSRNGSCQPYVYGSAPELGGGDITKAIPLQSVTGPYFFATSIQITKPTNGEFSWYSYFVKPKLGSEVFEQVSKRFITTTDSSTELDLYDTFDINNSIGELILHFRIRCFTQYGQELYICGNIPELGNWDINKSKQMYFENNLDYWSCIVRLPLTTSTQQIEYKYIRAYDKNNAE